MNPKTKARAILSAAGIANGQDFASLSVAQHAAIIEEAQAVYLAKYGKPMPEAFARKRYDLLQRQAGRLPPRPKVLTLRRVTTGS